MLGWLNKNPKHDARGMIVALYVLVTLSLVFAQRCLRPEQDAPEPSINQIDLAEHSLPATAVCAGALDTQRSRECGDQASTFDDIAAAANHTLARLNFAHSTAQSVPNAFAPHVDAPRPSTLTANARPRAPPALSI